MNEGNGDAGKWLTGVCSAQCSLVCRKRKDISTASGEFTQVIDSYPTAAEFTIYNLGKWT